MNTLSFMTANYVARQIGYNMTKGWMEGDDATNAYFAPIETYDARFRAMLAEIKGLGFTAVDIWLAHLNWRWATPEHLTIARRAIDEAGLTVVSIAGGFGNTREEVEASCRIAKALDTTILGGNSGLLGSDRPTLAALMREHGLRFGYENHPEKSTAELLAKAGEGDEDVIGLCVDTGWFGTHGYDAVQAFREVYPRLVHVHLKDVLAPGSHETCRYGRGCVAIEGSVHTLKELGYTGAISIEHEPEHYSPNEDCVANLAMVKAWLA
jgi:sugar phosphate isomerase/epimerase